MKSIPVPQDSIEKFEIDPKRSKRYQKISDLFVFNQKRSKKLIDFVFLIYFDFFNLLVDFFDLLIDI